MKIKTSELTGAALDWAVAQCEGHLIAKHRRGGAIRIHTPYPKPMFNRTIPFCPSTDWVQGGSIIEREKISLWNRGAIYAAEPFDASFDLEGPTPLIAAMRCYVASKLGNEIEIPKELK